MKRRGQVNTVVKMITNKKNIKEDNAIVVSP
jgi:hypothetical protein